MTLNQKNATNYIPPKRFKIKNHFLARFIGSGIECLDGLVGFITLGFYCPGWTMRWAVYIAKKSLKKK